MVINGYNFRSGAYFGRLDKLTVGDTVFVTDREGKTYTYTVYKLEHIKPDYSGVLSNTQLQPGAIAYNLRSKRQREAAGAMQDG